MEGDHVIMKFESYNSGPKTKFEEWADDYDEFVDDNWFEGYYNKTHDSTPVYSMGSWSRIRFARRHDLDKDRDLDGYSVKKIRHYDFEPRSIDSDAEPYLKWVGSTWYLHWGDLSWDLTRVEE